MVKTEHYNDALLGEYTYAQHESGLSVYVMEKKGFASSHAIFGTKYGSIDVKFSRNSGPEIEVPAGIAHFLEHKLFESEEGDAFTRFSATGAYANAYTSFDRTCYLFSCSKNFKENFEILLDFVQSPYFTAETVKKEQGIIGQEIKMYDDNPGWRVMFNLLCEMYEEHPVKTDIAGTVESISKIDDKLLYECYNTFYNPSNMFICVAGNVKTDEVLALVDKYIKKCEPVKVKKAVYKEDKKVKSHYVEQQLEVAKPIFCLGFKEILKTETPTLKDRIVASILLDLLCSDCSELYRRLVDSALIGDEFSAEYFCGKGYSAFIIEGETEFPETVAEEIQKEIDRLSSGEIDLKLLSAIKKSAYADAVKRFDSTDSIVSEMVDCALFGGGLFDTAEVLKSITAEDITCRLKTLRQESSVLSVIKSRKG